VDQYQKTIDDNRTTLWLFILGFAALGLLFAWPAFLLTVVSDLSFAEAAKWVVAAAGAALLLGGIMTFDVTPKRGQPRSG
jgi:predicted phage tail protein